MAWIHRTDTVLGTNRTSEYLVWVEGGKDIILPTNAIEELTAIIGQRQVELNPVQEIPPPTPETVVASPQTTTSEHEPSGFGVVAATPALGPRDKAVQPAEGGLFPGMPPSSKPFQSTTEPPEGMQRSVSSDIQPLEGGSFFKPVDENEEEDY